jgi:hypothetical protein
MTDETDVYLGRCLKNWAEREKSHARSKDSLLRLAAAQSKIDNTPASFPQDQFEEFRNYRQSVMYTGMYLRGSFTLSLGWTVDLSTLLRVAQ